MITMYLFYFGRDIPTRPVATDLLEHAFVKL